VIVVKRQPPKRQETEIVLGKIARQGAESMPQKPQTRYAEEVVGSWRSSKPKMMREKDLDSRDLIMKYDAMASMVMNVSRCDF
jgi:hypothetical protein